MTLEQAYKKVHMMDEVLDSDILNDEEYTSVAKRCFKLMAQIGLEEQRQKQLATYKPTLSDWEQGFLDSFVIQGHKCLQRSRRLFFMLLVVLNRFSIVVMCSNLSRTLCWLKKLMKKVFLKKFKKRLDTRSKM